MSTTHSGGHQDGQVVPLRAEDAATDTRVSESPGPSYADLSDGGAQRKPVIPAHWQTWQEVHLHLHGISAEDIAAIFDRRNE